MGLAISFNLYNSLFSCCCFLCHNSSQLFSCLLLVCNSLLLTLSNTIGQVISWSSAGKSGFRGSKKNTPYAAQVAAEDAAKTAYDLGLRKVKAYVKGPGAGRESAIRTIHGAGIEVTEIVDVTPMPHNGCRPKGRRKV